MRKFWGMGILLAAVVVTARAEDKAEMTAEKLVGTYKITGGETGGKKDTNERITDTVVKFTADKITVYDKDDKEVYVQTYKLDASKKPCMITMTGVYPEKTKGVTAKGLIEMDGDTLKLVYALPGGATPDDFKTEEKQNMFMMKKSK